MRKKTFEDIQITESSGNVYADLGFKNAEEMMAKAQLVIQIGDIIKQKKITQKKAAQIIGIDQPKVSSLLKGHFSGFTIERLFRFLMALGMDIVIETKPHTQRTTLPHILVMHRGKHQKQRLSL